MLLGEISLQIHYILEGIFIGVSYILGEFHYSFITCWRGISLQFELFTLPHIFLEESRRNPSLPGRITRIPPGIMPQPLSIKWL